jgi:hypothetical protein
VCSVGLFVVIVFSFVRVGTHSLLLARGRSAMPAAVKVERPKAESGAR